MRLKTEITTVGCEALAAIDPQALGVTCWFDAMPAGRPYPVTVRLIGHRLGGGGRPGPGQHFTTSETVATVVPGSGRVAVTTRIHDVEQGAWSVNASVSPVPHEHTSSATGATGYGPVVGIRGPAVHLGAWPAFVAAGAAAALVMQSWLAGRAGLAAEPTLIVSVIGSLFG